MSGLDNSTKQQPKSEEGGSGVDQKHERSSITDSSESSQTPGTPRCWLPHVTEIIVTEYSKLFSVDNLSCLEHEGKYSLWWVLCALVAVSLNSVLLPSDAGMGDYSHMSVMCQRKWWQAIPILFLLNYCFTFSVTTRDSLRITSVRFNDVRMVGRKCCFSCLMFCCSVKHFIFLLQTGEGLQGRSGKSRERAWGNSQGYWRVWRKAVQQNSAVWCETTYFFSDFRSTHAFSFKKIMENEKEPSFIIDNSLSVWNYLICSTTVDSFHLNGICIAIHLSHTFSHMCTCVCV